MNGKPRESHDHIMQPIRGTKRNEKIPVHKKTHTKKQALYHFIVHVAGIISCLSCNRGDYFAKDCMISTASTRRKSPIAISFMLERTIIIAKIFHHGE